MQSDSTLLRRDEGLTSLVRLNGMTTYLWLRSAPEHRFGYCGTLA